MQNRLWNFAAALVVGVVSTTGLAFAAHGKEARHCHASPKGAPPEGSHWFYTVDRAENRKCWYLGDEGTKRVRVFARRGRSAEKPVRSDSKPALSRQVADARAELQSSRANIEPADLPTRAPTAALPRIDANATPEDIAAAARWALAQRWPDRTEDNAATRSDLTVVASNAELPSNTMGATAPAPAPVTTTPPPARSSGAASSVQMVMIVLASLAVAGLVAAALLILAKPRRSGRTAKESLIAALSDDRAPWHQTAEAADTTSNFAEAEPKPVAANKSPRMAPDWLMTVRPN